MRDQVVRRPIPAQESILWKPLHDSHYVVASLQLGDGGRRKIFIRQQALARVEALVRAHGRRVVGLCLGHLYQCPDTGADYLVIESIVEKNPVTDENEIVAAVAETLVDRAAAIADASLARPDEHHPIVLGWYRGVATVEAKPTPKTAAAHTSLFDHPWQTALVVGEGANSGAFFLNDTVNTRWFYAPFYELPDHAPVPDQPKPTVISWPQYMTADSVSLSVQHATIGEPLRRLRDEVVAIEPALGVADGQVAGTPSTPNHPTPSSNQSASIEPQPLADRAVPRSTRRLADVLAADLDSPVTQRADRSTEKLSIVDDRDQRTVAPRNHRRVSEADDTVLGDDPGRYIELARTEGFFVASRFDTLSDSGRAETLWILNEPYSGMLLAIVATASEVIDATLHYNLQTDDIGLSKTPFPEHRDGESKTIYVRETCTDSLRARCRRLRATNALVREWKVTPKISFLTPAEWESLPADAGMDRGVDMIADLNNARIAELPEGVRNQFHLVVGNEASA